MNRVLMLTAMAILMPAVAYAQAPPPAQPLTPKTEQLDSKTCAGSDTHETVGQGVQLEKQNERNAGDKLARSGGVICPPEHVDPEIKAETPPGGRMPVIPPPANPSIAPK